jgi:hypothetical protein
MIRFSKQTGASRLLHRLRTGFALLVTVPAFWAPGTAAAQPAADRSLTATDTPAPGSGGGANAAAATDTTTPTGFPAGNAPSAPTDLDSLSREELKARIAKLTEEVASANAEAEKFRGQWADLKLRDEALGVEALTVDEGKLEDKLVQAVKEVYQSEMKHREALALLDKLMATTDQMIQTAPKYDPKVRAQYEEAYRAAQAYMSGHRGTTIPLASSLNDARIADLNVDLNAVILNVGRSQGVKEGMPFGLYQDNIRVATVKVVLARDVVCAAQIETVSPGTVLRIGDRASAVAEP